MASIEDFSNIHAHGIEGPGIVTNLPLLATPGPHHYSAGIHPWDLSALIEEGRVEQALAWVEEMAARPEIVAIGECGLDSRHTPAPPAAIQEDLFIAQARIAGRAGKPLVIHCTGQWHRLLALAPQLPHGVRRIVHGFRGKPELARQLLAAGLDLSFGPRHNPSALAATPPGRRFHETD